MKSKGVIYRKELNDLWDKECSKRFRWYRIKRKIKSIITLSFLDILNRY